jgi:hypothetical protein
MGDVIEATFYPYSDTLFSSGSRAVFCMRDTHRDWVLARIIHQPKKTDWGRCFVVQDDSQNSRITRAS